MENTVRIHTLNDLRFNDFPENLKHMYQISSQVVNFKSVTDVVFEHGVDFFLVIPTATRSRGCGFCP